MGVKLEIAGIEYDVEDYSVTEEATPLSLDDTAQSTGTMTAVVRLPEVFSESRKLKAEIVSNPVVNPIVTVDQVSYNPDEYSVSGPPGAVIVTRIAPGTSRFLVGDPLFFGADVILLLRGEGRIRPAYEPLPPLSPDFDPGTGWLEIDSDWQVVWGASWPTDYPGVGPISARLESVGDWVELSRRGLREDTLTGNSPNSVSSVRRLQSRWVNGENTSPTVSTWTSQVPGSDLVAVLGAGLIQGAKYRLIDSNKGVTSGEVSDVEFGPGGSVSISGITDLNQLNSFNALARPSNLSDYPGFNGTLGEAVRYYAQLSGVPYIWIDPEVENTPVSYPGWRGETWFHLKQLATIHKCELSFVSGFPVFRPVRGRTTEPGRWLSKRVSISQPSLALSVEAYNQNLRDIRDEYVVHPDFGDDTVFSAARGEVVEFTIDLPASVYRVTYVGAFFTREEGQAISWEQAGATVRINPEDSRQVLVTLAPPSSLRTERVYLGRLVNEVRVPGLYVRADGVAFTPEKVTYRTGVPEGSTGTEVGVTLDSPFISDSEIAGSVLHGASRNHAVPTFRLSGSVTNVNRRGDDGVPDFISYSEAMSLMDSRLGSGFSYEDLQAYTDSLERGNTYADFQSVLSTETSRDYRFQEFGNVAGSRIWDPDIRRWFRVRSATITPFAIENISAEDDLLVGEFTEPWEAAGWTYQQVQDSLPVGGPDESSPSLEGSAKITYGQLQLMGVPVV